MLVSVFIFVFFWSEYLFRDVYFAFFLSLVSVILSLRPRAGDNEEKEVLAFSHFLGFDGESAQNLVRLLHPSISLGNGLLLDGDVAYYTSFCYAGISEDELVLITRGTSKKAKKLVVYARSAKTEKISNFFPIEIEIRTERKLYEELKSSDLLPKIPGQFYNSSGKTKSDGRVKRAGYLVLSSISVLFSSLFSPFRIFFTLSASFLLMLAVFVLVKKEKSVVRVNAK